MCVLRGGIADFNFQSQQIGRICSGPLRPRDGVIAHVVIMYTYTRMYLYGSFYGKRTEQRARHEKCRPTESGTQNDTHKHCFDHLRNANPQVRVKLPSYTSWCQLVRARRKEACVQRESFLNAEA